MGIVSVSSDAHNVKDVLPVLYGDLLMNKNQFRKNRYAALAILKKEMQIAEESYRAVLKRHGAVEVDGRYSATTMSINQMDAVLTELKAKNGSQQRHSDWRKARLLKISKMWNQLAIDGVVRSAERKSLLRWARNSHLLQSERLEWATSEELSKMIEALKAWVARGAAANDVPVTEERV